MDYLAQGPGKTVEQILGEDKTIQMGKKNHISVLNFLCKFIYCGIVEVLFKDIQIETIQMI